MTFFKRSLIFFLFISLLPIQAWSATTQVILIPPVRYSGPPETKYLSQGLQDMFASELTSLGKLNTKTTSTPVDTDANAFSTGKANNASFVLLGSLSKMGDQFILSGRILDTKKKVPVFSYTEKTDSPSNLPQKISLVSKRFTNSLDAPVTQIKAEPVAAAPVQNKTVVAPISIATQVSVFDGLDISGGVVSIAIGQVGKNKEHRVAVLTDQNLFLYKYQSKNLVLETTFEQTDGKRFIHVDYGQISSDGQGAFVVTDIPANGVKPRLTFLSWDNNKLSVKFRKNGWFASTYQNRNTLKKELIVQSADNFGKVFRGSVSTIELPWKASPLNISQDLNLYNFANVQFDAPHTKSIVMLRERNRLAVLDSKNDYIWKGTDRLGGTTIFINGYKPKSNRRPNEDEQIKYNMPQKLHVISSKGSQDVILTVLNSDYTSSTVDNFKYFNNGYLVMYSWNGMALNQFWKSEKFPGGILDSVITDIDKDGVDEVLVAFSTGNPIKPESKLATYPLPEITSK